MVANSHVRSVVRMHDDVEELGGATPRQFPRVFISGENGSEERRDAVALAEALAGNAETVTTTDRADLIVTGSAQHGAPGRVALDPSSRALFEGASCPVAVAPRELAARDDYGIRRVDVGIDGGRGATAALATVIRVALAHSAHLRLIAVAELDFDLGGTAQQADPRELERLAGRLGQATAGLSGISVETELREGLADQIILGLAREADLLVLGSRATYGNAGRVALGDVAGRILRAAPCPTMVVPTA